MKRNLGDKGQFISDDKILEIQNIYNEFKENKYCKIFDNEFFGFTKIIIEQPLIKDGKIIKDKKGKYKTDPTKKDSEKIELSKNIDEYLEEEVKPNVPDFLVDNSKNQIGYEINFTKYFYKFEPLRNLDEISKELNLLNEKINELTKEVNE